MKRLTLLLFLMLPVVCNCQMQKITVNVYTPPKLVLPPEVNALLITSRYVPATGPYEDLQWGAYESVDSLKWKLSESIVDTLAKRMAADNFFMVKAVHFPRMLRNNTAQLPEPLPWEGLVTLSKKELVQGLLIIEGFDLTKSPVGFTTRNGAVTAQYSMDVKIAVRIYEADIQRIVDDSVYSFITEFQGVGANEQEAEKQLPDDLSARFQACSRAAESYYLMIKPGEVPAKRYFYHKGDSLMLVASKAIGEGKWGRAEGKWKWLAYNSKDTVIQAKASFNMALACERDGRTHQAAGFAKRSQRLNPDKKTVKYVDLLDRKILEYNNLIRQKIIIKKW